MTNPGLFKINPMNRWLISVICRTNQVTTTQKIQGIRPRRRRRGKMRRKRRRKRRGVFFSLTSNLDQLGCETWENKQTMYEAICYEVSTNLVYTLFSDRLYTIYSLGLYKKNAINY